MKLLNIISKKDFNRIRRHYTAILRKRDSEIGELKKQNQFLLQNALTQAQKRRDLAEHSKRLIEINRELKDKLENGN
jgi:hypothetical protein